MNLEPYVYAVPEKWVRIFTNNVKMIWLKDKLLWEIFKIICPMNVSSFLQSTKTEPNKLIAQHYKLMTTGSVIYIKLLYINVDVFDDVFMSCLSCFICFRHSQNSYFESEFFLFYHTDTQYIFCNIFILIFICIYIHNIHNFTHVYIYFSEIVFTLPDFSLC